MIILDGKIAANAYKEALKKDTEKYRLKGLRAPHLACILIGADGASETYVASKVKNCAAVGFSSSLIRLLEDCTEAVLLEKIFLLNEDPLVDGILVQLPLPKHIREEKILAAINPAKDVDGFNPINVGKMVQGIDSFLPATPYGILLLMEYYKIETKGKNVVVLGRSNIVGRPMSILLSNSSKYGNATVTVCHRFTQNLADFTQQADIVIAAVGVPKFLDKSLIKPGAVVIDVGITRVKDDDNPKGYTIQGDVHFEEVANIASAITPVPGGVGLMTIAALLKNTLKAYEANQNALG